MLFLRFISTSNPSMSFGKLCFVKRLLGMSLLTYISVPPRFRFWSSRKGEEKPSIRKLYVVNALSSFVSVSTNISTWFEMRRFDWSSFPDIELMFRFSIMTFFGFFNLTFLSSHIGSILLGMLEIISDNFAFLFKLLIPWLNQLFELKQEASRYYLYFGI